MDISSLSALEILKLYRARRLSPVEVAESCLKQVFKFNPVFNAFCALHEQETLRQAKMSEKRWQKGTPKGPLDGLPVTIKDWFHVKGWPTRQGSLTTSAILQPESSPQVARLLEAGAVILGKTTLPEFGHKGVTDSPLSGITRNPWDPSRTCGGSSGGAAVAAACGMGFLHLGSDAGGSIRIPASFTGVFGFKPTPGLVPSYPPSLFAPLSSAGPLARRVRDAALMLDVISNPDARDVHALPWENRKFFQACARTPKKLRIAYAPTINGVVVDKDVARLCARAVKKLSALGSVETITLDVPKLIETFNRHWMAVAHYIIEKTPPAQRKKMDPRLLDWARRGSVLKMTDYLDAQLDRMAIAQQFKMLLEDYDLLLTPATAMPAFECGTNMPKDAKGKLWEDWTPFTYPANLARLPAGSLPCGLTETGLPAGLQVMAAPMRDGLVLAACHFLEQETGFRDWLDRQT